MRAVHLFRALTVSLAALTLWGCPPKDDEQPLTREEALAAAEQSVLSSQASALTSESIEVATDFTIGEGARAAAEELAEFYRSQIPCSTVTLDAEGASVVVDYGTLDDGCVWRGRTYAGTHTVSFARNDDEGVEVTHTWAGFTQGTVTVSGDSVVTWSWQGGYRNVAHELTWSNDKHTMVGTGDRTQTLLDREAGVAGGLRVDGEKTWTVDDGETWSLTIDGVEIRGEDPIPQAGTYTLQTPRRSLSMTFERIDEDVIEITMSSAKRSFKFRVRRTGNIDG